MLAKNILVPVDFSDRSIAALDYATELAAKLDARVHLIHVVPLPMYGTPDGFALTAPLIDQAIKDGEASLRKLADVRRKTVPIGEVMLQTGDARDVILRAADEVNADLIVMGTHGRRGVSRALLGSVAESILRMATCPVLTVREPH